MVKAFLLAILVVVVLQQPVWPAVRDGWGWPLDGRPRVIRVFDPPPKPWFPGHRGVDLAASPGDAVRAAGAGRVGFAGKVAGRGVVTVLHDGGLRTTYVPVTPEVRKGDRVDRGEALGSLEDRLGHCPRACLHWGLRRGDRYLDPLALLGLGPVRLLPYWNASGPRMPAGPGTPGRPRATAHPVATAGASAPDRPTREDGRRPRRSRNISEPVGMQPVSASSATGGLLLAAVLALAMVGRVRGRRSGRRIRARKPDRRLRPVCRRDP